MESEAIPIRRHRIRESAGVCLWRLGQPGAEESVLTANYLVTSLRAEPSELLSEQDALIAFDLEVIASLSDPAVGRMLAERSS